MTMRQPLASASASAAAITRRATASEWVARALGGAGGAPAG